MESVESLLNQRVRRFRRVSRRRRLRPQRLVVSLLVVMAVGSWLVAQRTKPPMDLRDAGPRLAFAVAKALHPRVTVLRSPSGTPEVLAVGNAAQPVDILLDGSLSRAAPNVYEAGLNWVGHRLTAVRLGNPLGNPSLSAGDYSMGASGNYGFYATSVAGQFQTITVMRGVGQQRWLFALRVPASEVRLTPNNGKIRVEYRVHGGWNRASISLSPSGPRVVSGALTAVSVGHNHNSLFIRIVEGVRHYLGSGVVATAENIFYQLTDTLHRVFYHASRSASTTPSMASVTKTKLPTTAHPVLGHLPQNIALPASWPNAKGEGVWQPVGPVIGGAPSMEETFLHPDPQRPWATTYLVWINPAAVRLHYVAGTEQPASLSGIHGPGMLPTDPSVASKVVAAFNAGFKSDSTTFGAMADGELYSPPVHGIATLALYKDGHVALGAWGTSAVPQTGTMSYRQNLPLIVDQGKSSPLLNDPAAWGVVVGNSTYVWRSGIGITLHGDLVYAAGDPLSAYTLAQSLQAAGAWRAMQLDINSYWVTFNFYHWVGNSGAGYLVGQKLASAMIRPASRYLSPDTRDFFYLTKP